MKKILLFILGFGLASASMAQTKENPWTIGVYGVKTEYLGDLSKYSNEWASSNYANDARNTIFNFNLFYGGGALSFDRYLNNYFDAGIYSSFGTVGYKDKSNVARIPRSFNAKLSNTNVHVRIKILGPDDGAKFVPYLNFGVGLLAYFKGRGVTATNANEGDTLAVTAAHNPSSGLIVNGGIGLEYRINSHFGVRYQADFGWTSRDNVDFYTRDGANDWQLQHSLGVTYSFDFAKKAKKSETPIPVPTPVLTPAPAPAASTPTPTPEPASKPEIKTENKACYSIEEMVDFLDKGTDVSDKKICMYNLNFDFGKSTIDKSSLKYLDKVVLLMQKNPTILVTVNGHADNVGSAEANLKLSKDRASAVCDYLKDKGISPARLKYKYYGSSMPIASNDSEAGRAQNRRVEFEINKAQ